MRGGSDLRLEPDPVAQGPGGQRHSPLPGSGDGDGQGSGQPDHEKHDRLRCVRCSGRSFAGCLRFLDRGSLRQERGAGGRKDKEARAKGYDECPRPFRPAEEAAASGARRRRGKPSLPLRERGRRALGALAAGCRFSPLIRLRRRRRSCMRRWPTSPGSAEK